MPVEEDKLDEFRHPTDDSNCHYRATGQKLQVKKQLTLLPNSLLQFMLRQNTRRHHAQIGPRTIKMEICV